MASYRAAYLIAKSKKAHNIGENFIKPCVVEMANILLGNEAARKMNKISMSDNSVKRGLPTVDICTLRAKSRNKT